MKVFFDSLGCPKALVDAERMCYFLEQNHHILVPSPDEADAIVVNTCGFIESAKQENIHAILNYTELKKQKPGLKIIVSGCLTERYKDELLRELPEVDSAIGVRDHRKIVEALSQHNSQLIDEGEYRDTAYTSERKLVFSGLHYAYLKISEGCSRSCSFCAIPGIRGKLRSRPMEDILKETVYLMQNGMEEIILISEDTLSYGTDLYHKRSLLTLIEKLAGLGMHWLRVMYLFPEEDTLAVVELMQKHPNICAYIDMPLQHASPSILKSMHRYGGAKEYLSLISRMRETIPRIHIRSSFIVGYPGETDADFEVLKQFLVDAKLDRVGFFEYSQEEGTIAAKLKPVPKPIVQKRLTELTALQETISQKNLSRLVGQSLNCIHDAQTQEMEGQTMGVYRSEFDAPEIDGSVYVPWNDTLESESFQAIKIEKVLGNHDLAGSIL